MAIFFNLSGTSDQEVEDMSARAGSETAKGLANLMLALEVFESGNAIAIPNYAEISSEHFTEASRTFRKLETAVPQTSVQISKRLRDAWEASRFFATVMTSSQVTPPLESNQMFLKSLMHVAVLLTEMMAKRLTELKPKDGREIALRAIEVQSFGVLVAEITAAAPEQRAA